MKLTVLGNNSPFPGAGGACSGNDTPNPVTASGTILALKALTKP